ncbi:SAF domain-containing protein [Nonomuraea sp. KM90]|uniref:SAF domain-containing protein n=1 Tax=Nonomuraea sp. KM90 TaxID=3457428 RepID=UPI003FCECDBF
MTGKIKPDTTQEPVNPELPPAQVPKLLPQSRQRRRSSLVLGVLVVLGGMFLAFQVVNRLSNREPVLVITRDLALGQPITAENVSIAMVGGDESVAMVRGEDLHKVIGMRAAVDLMSGTLLQHRMVTDQVTPLADQQLIPIAVKPSRLPARGLRPGDRLSVMFRPENPTAAAQEPSGSVEAVVDHTKGPDNDGLMVVDVLVNRLDAAKLGPMAADGQVALALMPRRP